MRAPLMLRTFAAAILLAFLGAAMTMYVQAQGLLLKEANSAYSPDAVLVGGSPKEALSIAERENLEVLIFTPMADDWKMRAVAATRGAQNSIPIHDPQRIVDDEHPGTLMGREAAKNGGHGAALPPTAAYLGSSNNSLLGDLVLIYDPRLVVDSSSAEFVIDGPDVEILAKSFQIKESKREGLSRRTSVDAVAPLLMLLSVLLLVACSALSAALFQQRCRTLDRVARLCGASRPRIVVERMLAYFAVWLLGAVVVGAAISQLAAHPLALPEYGRAWGLTLLVSLIALAATYAKEWRVIHDGDTL